jgi:uncharacterized protein YndB with AHSA1/START domain
MDAPTLVHDTFVLETTIDAAPSRVFGAYADVRTRQEWASPGGDAIVYDQADFRVGSGDRFRCGPKNDLRFHGAVEYHEIVQDTRFVFVESIRVGDQTLSLGMVTWELRPEGDRTRLQATTQMVSFVGPQMVAGSKSGTQAAMNNLAAWLARAPSRP